MNEEIYSSEVLESKDVKSGFIEGLTFNSKPIEYLDVDGLAVFEGDIILGTVEEMDQLSSSIETDANDSDIQFGVGITAQRYRWPQGLVPYTISSSLSNQRRVTDAIAHWQQRTRIRFVRRTNSNASQYPNYVNFIPSSGCWSHVGMRGGKQDIGLANGCGTGSTIHEIAHAIGLWHEQSREDRDSFIRVNWNNITTSARHNFNQHITDGDDHGRYDYDSLMHYGTHAFSRNRQPTIDVLQSGATIGQRNGLSTGDIAAIRAMYPSLEPSRTWLGTQFKGTIRRGSRKCWSTHSWPAHWHVDWTVMPLDPPRDSGAQIEWTIQVTRQTDKLAKYFICVKNLVNYDVKIEARYHILGWIR